MIKNERQLRITKAKVAEFKDYLSLLETNIEKSVNPVIAEMERSAIRGQIEDLENQIKEYDSLWNSQTPIPELHSFEELPRALIRARISLGLSQKDLAERIGVKEQQIQRYEADEYQTASLARVRELIVQLNVKMPQQVELPSVSMTYREFFARLQQAGIDPEFVISRIPPRDVARELENKDKDKPIDETAVRFAQWMAPVYNWTPDQVLGTESLQIDMSHLGSAQFKMRSNANRPRAVAQAFYAHYLSLLVLQGCKNLPRMDLPKDPFEIHASITKTDQVVTPYNALKYVWSLGVPVMMIVGSGGTQGTRFRERGRNVLVLSNSSSYQASLLFVLFHELWHAVAHQTDEEENRGMVMEEFQNLGSETNKRNQEERTANQFAGAVLLGRNPGQLAKMCVEEARHDMLKMKQAVQLVARREEVPVDVLANIVAFRLAEQRQNWWGAASNLQKPGAEMQSIASTLLAEHIDPIRLSKQDLDLLSRGVNLRELSVA